MTATATPTTKRRPIRGVLYGIVLGLGLMMIVVGQGIAALGTWPPFLVLLAGIVIGALWSTFGPAKAPKGPPPIEPDVIEPSTPEPSAPEPGVTAQAEPDPVADAPADGGEATTEDP